MKKMVAVLFAALALLAIVPAAIAAQCSLPNKVTVFWDALPTGNDPSGKPYATVDHVEIWRADGACSTSSNFTKQYAGAVDVLQFDDVNVAQGQTYCWIGYSFDAQGRKSGPSNTAECSIPLAPLPVVPNLRAK